MWRKTTEAKPAPAASKTPGPASTTETPKQTQAAPQRASTTPATGSFSAAASSSATAPAASQTPAKLPTATPAPAVPAAPAKSVASSASPEVQTPSPTPQPVGAEEPSTISAGLKIKGEITGTSDLTIHGETQGKVRLTNGRVTVGPAGRVIADIDAREIVVNGTVQGNLKASDSVRLGSSGYVEGSILAARIGIEDGARLRGNVEMIRPGEAQVSDKRERQDNGQAARAATASLSQDSD